MDAQNEQAENREQTATERREAERAIQPRIYVASLSDYNNGVLHGVWLGADQTVDGLYEGIHEMLAASPTAERYGEVAEEFALHDYENFEQVQLSEYESLERVSLLGRTLALTEPELRPALGHFWSRLVEEDGLRESEPERVLARFEEQFRGEYASAADYGLAFLEDMGVDLDKLEGMPQGLRPYLHFDASGWVRDLELEGFISVVESKAGVYVFENNFD